MLVLISTTDGTLSAGRAVSLGLICLAALSRIRLSFASIIFSVKSTLKYNGA